MIDNGIGSDTDFLISPPVEGSRDRITLKIFFFGQPKSLTIDVSKKSEVNDVIRHIMTLYKRDKSLMQWRALVHPEMPEAYELRLIDDEDYPYMPFMDIAAL